MSEERNESLKECLLSYSLKKIDEDLKNSKKVLGVSHKETKKMSESLGIDIRWHPSARRVVAIVLVAVLIALSSCGIIYRKEIGGFVIHFFEKDVSVVPSQPSDNSGYVNLSFNPKYVPQGYTLVFSKDEESIVERHWKRNNDTIILQIIAINGAHIGIDNGPDSIAYKNVGDYKLLSYESTNSYIYLWNDGDFGFVLLSDKYISNSALQDIVTNVSIRTVVES